MNDTKIEADEDAPTALVQGVAEGRVSKAEAAAFFKVHAQGSGPPL